MKRLCYQALLLIHPRGFRREFAGEMLWIFDEASQNGDTLPLFADAFLSLGRQWIVRQGTWKVAVATVGGFFYIVLAMSALTAVPVRAGFALRETANMTNQADGQQHDGDMEPQRPSR